MKTFVVRGFVKVEAETYQEAIFKAILTLPNFNMMEGIRK